MTFESDLWGFTMLLIKWKEWQSVWKIHSLIDRDLDIRHLYLSATMRTVGNTETKAGVPAPQGRAEAWEGFTRVWSGGRAGKQVPGPKAAQRTASVVFGSLV